MIKATVDFTDIKRTLNSLTDEMGQTLWYKIATKVFSRIIRNIQSGIDIDGKNFKDYSSGYKKKRTKNGLGLLVNLQFTSNMLRSITIDANRDGFAIFITGFDNESKAKWTQEQGRVFLDWGKTTIEEFEKALMKEVEDIFKGF